MGAKRYVAQMHRFAEKENIEGIAAKAKTAADPVKYLQSRLRDLLYTAIRNHYNSLATRLSGKDVIVMGEKTHAFATHGALLAEVKVAATIAWPGKKVRHRIACDEIHKNFDSNIPILMFGESYYRFARYLRRQLRLPNPLYGPSVFEDAKK